jgi:uncharacterized membrane protein
MIATPFLVSLVFAQPTYSPGVKVGDSVTFGKISAIWMSNSTPPRFIQQFNHTVSVQETITSASGKTVTANQTFNYENGTSETFTGIVNVQDGNGTLGIFVIAGELSAGDQVYQAPSPSSFPRIGETVTKPYANALRSINVVNATDNLGGPQSQILLHWDVNTGLLLEVLEKASYPSNKYSLYFEVTSTNVWQPSSIPDFGFDTIQHSSMSLHLGEPGIYTLTFDSTNNFTGIINLWPTVLNSTQPKPGLSLTQNNVLLVPGHSNSSALKFSTNDSTPLGTYMFSVNGTSNGLSHTVILAVTVSSPDFEITAQPANLTIETGTSKTSVITIRSLGNLSGNALISVTANGLLSATLQPATLTLTSGVALVNSTLTVQAPPNAPLSQFDSVIVTSTIGSLSHQLYIPINVIGPDFRISANPSILSLRAGATGQSTITLTSFLGFNGTVSLNTIVFGIVASLDRKSVFVNSTTPGTAALTISVPITTSSGLYSVFVDGNTTTLTRSAFVAVNVTAPGFRMTVNPSSVTLKVGANSTATITLASILGFQAKISMVAYDFNSNGPIVSVNPSNITLAANATATSKLTISASSAIAGVYSIQIIAVGGSLTRSARVTVTVIGPDFMMSASPSYLTLLQGNSATSIVTLSSTSNFNGTVALSSIFGGPSSGLNASIAPASVTLSSTITTATVNVTIRVSKDAAPGFYYIEPIGTSGRISHSSFIEIIVTLAPEFEINAASPTDFNAGDNRTSTITVTPLNGFGGILNLTSSASPNAGLAVDCPSSLNVTSLLSVSGICTLSSSAPGTYTVIVTATSGGLTHTTTFVVDVGGFTISVKTPVDFNSGASGEVLVSIRGATSFAGNITLTGFAPGLTVKCPATAVLTSATPNVETSCSVNGIIAGTYGATITGTASPGSLSRSVPAVVHVGGFTISATSGSFNTGAPGTSITVSLTSRFDFAGSVSISAATAPSIGLNADCPASPIPLTSNSTSTASCILSSTSPDTYQVMVTGKGTPGSPSDNATVMVHVGDFDISVTSSDINYGNDGSISVSLTSVNNFAGTISLSGTTTSGGLTVTCPIAPTSITENSTVTASCSLSLITPGTYSVTITGTGSIGTPHRSASAVVHGGDFIISIQGPVSFNVGGPNAFFSVNLTSTLNFAGTVVLTPNVSPEKGLTVTCPTVTLIANASSSAYCDLNADSAGTFILSIRGSSLPGNGSHSNSGIVQVVDFTVSAGAVGPSTIADGGSGTSSITIMPVNGFSGTVTLALSPPNGLACSFDHTTIQSSGSSNLSCTSNESGDYAVVVTATAGSTFHVTSLTFHFGSASAGVSPSPTMFGLELPQFYGLVGGIIVVIAVAGVTKAVKRKRP